MGHLMTSTKIVSFIAQCLCELSDLERFERCNRFVSAATEERTSPITTAENMRAYQHQLLF